MPPTSMFQVLYMTGASQFTPEWMNNASRECVLSEFQVDVKQIQGMIEEEYNEVVSIGLHRSGGGQDGQPLKVAILATLWFTVLPNKDGCYIFYLVTKKGKQHTINSVLSAMKHNHEFTNHGMAHLLLRIAQGICYLRTKSTKVHLTCQPTLDHYYTRSGFSKVTLPEELPAHVLHFGPQSGKLTCMLREGMILYDSTSVSRVARRCNKVLAYNDDSIKDGDLVLMISHFRGILREFLRYKLPKVREYDESLCTNHFIKNAGNTNMVMKVFIEQWHENARINLGDLFESLSGALFLDGGWNAIHKVYGRILAPCIQYICDNYD